MFTEEERDKWRQLVARWKAGEKVFDAGKRIENTDATTVQRQEPVQPIKRNFIAEAQRKHAAETVGPDYRSSYQHKQAQAAKQYANLQYQKAKDDAKRAEGMEQMMKTISPSTYIEAATGLDLGAAGRLVTDAVVFGLPGFIKNVGRKAYHISKPSVKLSVNADIAKDPYIDAASSVGKTSFDIAKESSTVRELNLAAKIVGGNRISDAYSKIKSFLNSPQYKKRLEKYYRDKGSSIITQNVAPEDRIGELLYNIETSKLKIMPRGRLVDEAGTVHDSFGMYDPNSHSIQIASDAVLRLTPEHEMWHAARNARTYLDNEKYKMRVRSLSDPVYYEDMSELEVRVLDTLREMLESGLDINNLTDDQIWNFLHETPIDLLGTNVQSLIDNYWYDDIKQALRNFKGLIPPTITTGIGYSSYNKYAE